MANAYGNVFVNRTLNMKRINYVGLDMDHTLIRYNTEAFEALAHKCMLEKLVNELNYPQSVLKLKFDFERAIRGLVIDKFNGNILKLSRYGAIRESYHGLQPIDFRTQRKLYKSTYIDLADPNYDAVDTSFAISFATLFAQLVHLKDSTEQTSMPDYNAIATDLTYVLDQAHRDGSIKDVVKDDLDKYIVKDAEIVEGIEDFVRHGKKVFIATNSDYFYSKLLLDYAINPFLKHFKHWSDLFEFTITLASKPRFFYDRLPFLKINPEDGSMINTEQIEKGGIYQGGCADSLTQCLNISPEEILYIGDHIYGDIVRLKKECSWRTALVVEEINQEIQSSEKATPFVEKIDALMDQKIPLENKIDQLISDQILNDHKSNETQIHNHIEKVKVIDKSISDLIKDQRACFNPYWGELFRTGIEESYFAFQVERFACVYMPKLSDLMSLSARTYFRSLKQFMAHER